MLLTNRFLCSKVMLTSGCKGITYRDEVPELNGTNGICYHGPNLENITKLSIDAFVNVG